MKLERAGAHKNMVRGMFAQHSWKIISLCSCSAPNVCRMQAAHHVSGALVYTKFTSA